jgi:hypothetical protein
MEYRRLSPEDHLAALDRSVARLNVELEIERRARRTDARRIRRLEEEVTTMQAEILLLRSEPATPAQHAEFTALKQHGHLRVYGGEKASRGQMRDNLRFIGALQRFFLEPLQPTTTQHTAERKQQ